MIGTGGFASGPLLLVAAMKGVPTLIQEQNSLPGITNKLLSKKVNKVCVAYEGLERFFPKEKLILTGNPVRQDLLDLDQKSAEAQAYFNLDPNKKTLLVLGGSLGSRRVNQLIESELDFLDDLEVQTIWQCGDLYSKDYEHFSIFRGSASTYVLSPNGFGLCRSGYCNFQSGCQFCIGTLCGWKACNFHSVAECV